MLNDHVQHYAKLNNFFLKGLQVGWFVRCRINGKIVMIICKSVLLYVCVFSSTTECTIKCLIVVKGNRGS